ncbi:hypothetical protein vseg_016381 [Gypsophila vaccaria]
MDRRTSFPQPLRSKPYLNSTAAVDVDGDDSDDNHFEDDGGDEDYRGHRFRHGIPTRHPRKQRKLTSLNYHFTPPPAAGPTWSDEGTFVLLEIWGERFLQLGRTSLRGEDWKDVAERVSKATRSNVEVSECRNRMNVLKGKYKREKAKWGVLGGGISKWVFYRKMEGLLSVSPRRESGQCGLDCGVDSGEFVFMNPRVYLEQANALDEMRDSPGNSESEGSEEDGDDDEEEEDEEDEDEEEEGEGEEESYRMLSESIKRVGEIYEKIEESKRSHMMELERMRAEFQRDLELQKKAMVDRTTAEIEKLGDRGERSSNCSLQNVVG